MNRQPHTARLLSLIGCIILLIGTPLQATDTEIYLGSSSAASGVKPNITFIIDTSGSMGTNVKVTIPASGSGAVYDPAVTYSGSCPSGRIYWKDSSTSSIPLCGSSNWFNASANTCNSATTAMAITGIYLDKIARATRKSKKPRWSTLSKSAKNNSIECQADAGIHGKTATSSDKFARESNNKKASHWKASSSNALNWDGEKQYTLYSSNYLNYRKTVGATSPSYINMTRLEIVQEVFEDLMNSISGVNVAVMRFDSYSNGGYFVKEMQLLSDTNRLSYIDAVNAMNDGGGTPLAETLYESYLYYKGGSVKYGNSSKPGKNVAGVLDSSNSSRYDSPIEFQCQKNFTILLTDGEPYSDTGANSAIRSMPGFSTVTGATDCSGNCLDELAHYMNAQDCSSTLSDTQNVITYTIGFATNQALLQSAASLGGGKYYTADNIAGLTDAFTNIITDILAINTTFIAPAVSVNAFNRFTHRDELYYALFRPNARPAWNGNIKRFKLAGSPAVIQDSSGSAAIDDNTGFFKATATSFWTSGDDAPDGATVERGGAAAELTLPRTVYTYTGTTAPNNVDLSASAHTLSETNSTITKGMLGDAAMEDAVRDSILQWVRGVDLFDEDSDGSVTDIRRSMGDPLHSKPVLITYGGTDAAPDMTLYAPTNEGFLHAVDTDDGSEVFAFMPQELLANLPLLYEDSGVDHPYGLDGPLSYWVNDANNNGVILSGSSLESGEFAYLYQAMRRGGSNYYALDVSTRSQPKLKWIIKGGSGDFDELGQSWSEATKARVTLNSTVRDVLLFGGGYDVGQDANSTAEDDAIGRAIYMVDAATGAKLWQAGPDGSGADLELTKMTNSIPSNLTAIDVDTDGLTDRIYVGDMRGQIWRIDFNQTNSGASDLATGAVIATLGGSSEATNRRFYYAPDVSLSLDSKYINIAIGSGYRAHPLNNTVEDAFFVIRDPHVYTTPADADGDGSPDYTNLSIADLYNATDNLIGQGSASDNKTLALTELASSSGWYLMLHESDGSYKGEKVLSKALSLDGAVLFSTYTPTEGSANSCSPSQGRALVYYISLTDATPQQDHNQSGGDLTKEDRAKDLVRGGIPPEPTIIFTDSGPVVLVGTEKGPSATLNISPRKIYWHQD